MLSDDDFIENTVLPLNLLETIVNTCSKCSTTYVMININITSPQFRFHSKGCLLESLEDGLFLIIRVPSFNIPLSEIHIKISLEMKLGFAVIVCFTGCLIMFT